MKTQWRVAWLFPVVFLLAGCEEETTAPEPYENVSPTKPNGNALVISETKQGEPDRWSSFWHVEQGTGGEFYFTGQFNSYWSVGCLNASGALLWSTRTLIRPRDLLYVELPSGVAALLLIGVSDTDLDSESEIGYANLYDTNGFLLSQVLYNDANDDLWVNSVAALTDSTFLVVGGRRTTAAQHPFVATLSVSSANVLTKENEITITTIGDRFAREVIVDRAATLPGQSVTCYTVNSNDRVGVVLVTESVSCLQLPYDLSSAMVEWTHDIDVIPGKSHGGDNIAMSGGIIFVAGQVESNKTPPPSNGGCWDSAFMLSLTTAGVLRWQTLVEITNYGDDYFDVFAGPGGLYAAGRAGHFSRDNRIFGYGWITKFDEDTGDAQWHVTIGSDVYRSYFNELVVSGATATAVGHTMSAGDGQTGLAWFAEVELRNPFLRAVSDEAPAAQAMRVAETPDRQGF